MFTLETPLLGGPEKDNGQHCRAGRLLWAGAVRCVDLFNPPVPHELGFLAIDVEMKAQGGYGGHPESHRCSEMMGPWFESSL